MAIFKNYPTLDKHGMRRPFKEVIKDIDEVIESNNMKDTLVLGEGENGCVILVGTYEDARALGGEYTGWCICDYPESFEKYCNPKKGLVQLFIVDCASCKDENTMLGVTLRIDKIGGKLDYVCAFFGKDVPLEDIAPSYSDISPIERAKWLRSFVNQKLMDCGNFNLKELYDFISSK